MPPLVNNVIELEEFSQVDVGYCLCRAPSRHLSAKR
ncbi:hypothetical protein X963_2656 [Burkholderia pseudomallei MSHR7498]|nr:hypothetical protein DO65_6183 [Burkholderia pseudomallei]KGR93097.1 hypothetical protein X948_5734 [Burkholderia pseudomallei MSHR5608]KGR96774.1 hypothetical protein X977_5499 [Burkholderia pseudomallei MSHR7504]KGS17282.1 hypothetical protein X989_5428 [Burkholderia pseudomallei MSHR4378]KGS45597.1 hypothetical protein X945_2715 [Burkholderia pseudomallei ABCPW 107]KGS58030.1 hypothetical protein X949_3048 [Burkholderia pseudomallei MSHR5609]KGS70427.1 hypothetical protein X990_2487 [Bu